MEETLSSDCDLAVAQTWFEYMANAGETRDSRHYFDAEEEASSRSILQAAKKASGATAFHREIAQQMNYMSVRERERRLEEMHGVPQIVNETPEIVDNALNRFHTQVTMEIENGYDPRLYDHALALDRAYIEGRKFRLMFLRAELFEVSRAVKRMFLFLEKKTQFFGPDKLGRPLLLSDLDVTTRKVLQAGDMQILPYRDRAGRPVIWQNGLHCGRNHSDSGLHSVSNSQLRALSGWI